MVEIFESNGSKNDRGRTKQLEILAKQVFKFPYSVSETCSNIFVSVFPYVPFKKYNVAMLVNHRDTLGDVEVDYTIKIHKENCMDRAEKLAELIESKYKGSKVGIHKDLI
ncbi:hypothetical protein HOD29_04855 [archaeon]|jgi:hypothetical protein|nr:hypothetical protein [archaeon]